MGGHGGLNILPQKRWNVYNFDNREKVKRDEEAASKEEQVKREQSRKRDSEYRLEQLRQARGLASASASVPLPDTAAVVATSAEPVPEVEPESMSKLNHINLFDGIRIFDPVKGDGGEKHAFKKMKVATKKEEPRIVMPDDEKYRLGYGVAGKGVKLPWYMSKPIENEKSGKNDDSSDEDNNDTKYETKSSGKKTMQQLREERLAREKREKERERALIREKRGIDRDGYKDRGYSRPYNTKYTNRS